MSDLVGNPNCWFSHAQAHIIKIKLFLQGQGIWYVFPDEPVGPSKNLVYAKGEAFRTPLWKFDNNKVHSVEKVSTFPVYRSFQNRHL